MRVRLSDDAVAAIITALDFCLMGEGEVFVDENGHDDAAQVAAAQATLDRLLQARR